MIISVEPNFKIANKIALPTGLKPKTMHVTLAYLGKSVDVSGEEVETVRDTIRELAPKEPFPFELTSLEKFTNVFTTTDPDGTMIPATYPTDVYYLAVKSEALFEFRARLVESLDEKGIFYSKIHKDFKPHMSLIYVPSGMNIQLPYELPISGEFSDISILGDPNPLYTYVLGSRNLVNGLSL